MHAKTVLLVEDNEDNRLIYEAILRHYGYNVVCAADGTEGLELAAQQLPDLILLDIGLPRLSGWDVAARLRSEEKTRHIVVVALTAHAHLSDRERASQIGFHGYLCKPVEPSRVLDEVQRWIGPARGPVDRAVGV